MVLSRYKNQFGLRLSTVFDFKTFGDEEYCEEWQPDIKYDPAIDVVIHPQKIYHTY